MTMSMLGLADHVREEAPAPAPAPAAPAGLFDAGAFTGPAGSLILDTDPPAERTHAMPVPATADAAALAAAYAVADAYDDGRRAGYLDLGVGRRNRAIAKLHAEANRRARDEGYRGGIVDVELTVGDLLGAFGDLARERIARTDGEPASVRNALRRAARELDRQHSETPDDGEFLFTLHRLGVAAELERIRSRDGGRDVEA